MFSMQPALNETNEHILAAIRTWVWSGFYGEREVQEMIADLLEDGADEAMLRGSVAHEFEEKAAAELTWPEKTDCDRLDEAFAALEESSIIALHNAGYTMSDGLSDVGEALNERVRSDVRGYCFYHEQDLERAVRGEGLTIAFGDLDDDPAQRADVGRAIKRALEAAGLETEWSGDSERRIQIPELDYKRRLARDRAMASVRSLDG
jgi:hypothetical protein